MEKLKEILGEELFNQVQEKLKDTDIKLDGKIPYDRFNEVNNKKIELMEQVKQLQSQVDTLKSENDKLSAQIQSNIVNSKIDDILRNSGAKKIETLKKILDLSDVQDNEESLNQLQQRVDELKQSDPYLFSKNEVAGNIPNNNNAGNSSISKDDFRKMSYSEKAALYASNRALYDSLK